MDIGIVTPRYPPNVAGGGEISVRLLAEQLEDSSRVDNLTVLSFDGDASETRNGVEVRRLADISSFLTEWQNARAYRHIRRFAPRFDVLHGYNMELYPAIGAVGQHCDVPTVGTLNSYHFLPKSAANVSPDPLDKLYEFLGYPTTGRILRYYVKEIDSFLALSDAVRRIYSQYGFNPNQIDVLPNCLDPSFSVSPVERMDEFTVLYVGGLSKIKGVEYLVRAFTELQPDYHLRVVGDGPMAGDLKLLASELGIRERVTFVGYVDHEDIPEQYARADLFVHPCVLPEPFGRTILEAMQAGLPVVCTDIGGPADIVREDELRCPPRDPDALAAAIERARERGPELGEENQQYVYQEFSPSAVIPRIIDIYERVQR